MMENKLSSTVIVQLHANRTSDRTQKSRIAHQQTLADPHLEESMQTRMSQDRDCSPAEVAKNPAVQVLQADPPATRHDKVIL